MTRTETLIQLMEARHLSAQQVADILSVKVNTVWLWRCKNPTEIPAAKLELLDIKTAEKLV